MGTDGNTVEALVTKCKWDFENYIDNDPQYAINNLTKEFVLWVSIDNKGQYTNEEGYITDKLDSLTTSDKNKATVFKSERQAKHYLEDLKETYDSFEIVSYKIEPLF